MQARRLQIRTQLGKMDVFQGLDRFQFHDDLLLYNEIKSMESHFDGLKDDADLFLPLESNSAVLKCYLH